jgi:hypothetical protein
MELKKLKLTHSLQIEALKEVGVTEVVLAINYRPEVKIASVSQLILVICI